MAKKMKLNLEDLKVQSFVTAIEKSEKEVIKGKGITLLTRGNVICTAAINGKINVRLF